MSRKGEELRKERSGGGLREQLFHVCSTNWRGSPCSRPADMKCVAVVRGCSFSAAAAILRAAAAAGHGFLFDAMHAIACDHMLELLFACELEDNFHMNFFT